jgi:hypothetical protein
MLWAIQSVSNKKESSNQPILNTFLDVKFSDENRITSTKKQKPGPRDASESEGWAAGLVLPYHQPSTPINQVAPSITGVTQADMKP